MCVFLVLKKGKKITTKKDKKTEIRVSTEYLLFHSHFRIIHTNSTDLLHPNTQRIDRETFAREEADLENYTGQSSEHGNMDMDLATSQGKNLKKHAVAKITTDGLHYFHHKGSTIPPPQSS